MDINTIYILLKSHQNEDNSVTCYWDFNEAGKEDRDGNTTDLVPNDYKLEALYAPDSKNPLLTRLPSEIELKMDDKKSNTYKSKNSHFTVGEILEAVRSFIEKIYNEKYSNGKYTFKDMYFEGLSGMWKVFEVNMEIANTLPTTGLAGLAGFAGFAGLEELEGLEGLTEFMDLFEQIQ